MLVDANKIIVATDIRRNPKKGKYSFQFLTFNTFMNCLIPHKKLQKIINK